jgi:superfamily II DNA/RNA helicase
VAVKVTTNEYAQVEVRPDVADPAVSYMTANQIRLKGVSSQSQYIPVLDFDQMKLPPSIKSILKNEGFQAPTPIQALAWPIVLAKRDAISVARTGSGAN